MNKWLLTGVFLVFQLVSIGQTLSGHIADKQGNPVQGAHIYCLGSDKGAISDNNGRYTFNADDYCPQIIISHLKYEPLRTSIHDLTIAPNVVLEEKSFNIPVVDVYSKPVIELLPDTPLFINDYEILSDRIYLCAFFQRKLNSSRLLYTDLDGTILDCENLSETGELYKDPEGSVYLTQKEFAFQLFVEDSAVSFSEPFASSYVLNAREHWTHSVGDSVILRYYYYRNQGVGYYIRQLPDDSASLWIEYVDEDALDRMMWGGFFDGNEFDKRFEDLIVYKPVKIPVFLREKDILAFNFITWKIEHLNYQGEKISETDMLYSEKNNTEKEIYFDAVSGKYYGREVRNGLNRLIEIDLNTGMALQSFTFKGYPHIEKLQVSAGVLYFLYKDYAGDQYKRLYKSPLINPVAGY